MIKDYTGKVIGKLTLVERIPNYKCGNTYYRCVCECGNECFISSSAYTSKKRISCGCMSKCLPKDLTGKRFHKLVAVERHVKYKNNRTYYKCVCDCGKEKFVETGALTGGRTKSCGCWQAEHPSHVSNHVGKIYGHLVAIERIEDDKKKGNTKYLCRCDCGNEVIVNGKQLASGYKKKCGSCDFNGYRKGRVYPTLRKDYTGQKFGKLTVIEMLYNYKPRVSYVRAKCNCGGEKIIRASSLTRGLVRSCGCLYGEMIRYDDLSGKTFNWLTAIEPIAKSGKSKSQYWKCKCECGNEVITTSHSLKNNKKLSCGCVSMRKSQHEKRVRKFFKDSGIAFQSQKIFADCFYERCLPFDFYVEFNGNRYCIECQGEQHFRPISFFGGDAGFELQRRRDNIKAEWCKANGVKLIYIPYYFTDENIKNTLNHTLNLVTTTAV